MGLKRGYSESDDPATLTGEQAPGAVLAALDEGIREMMLAYDHVLKARAAVKSLSVFSTLDRPLRTVAFSMGIFKGFCQAERKQLLEAAEGVR